jgi:hypothetical protein
LIRAWRLALDAEELRLHRTEVVAGPAYAALEQVLAGDSDTQDAVRLWKEIADIAVSGPTQLAVGDDRMSGLDEFARPWGPRALGEMYRINEEVDLGDLVDKLITDYHGPDAEEMLSMMAGAAVRAGQLAGTEAGVVAVTVPVDAELDPMVCRSATLQDEPI